MSMGGTIYILRLQANLKPPPRAILEDYITGALPCLLGCNDFPCEWTLKPESVKRDAVRHVVFAVRWKKSFTQMRVMDDFG